MSDDQVRVMLWMVPRSLATAVLRSMSNLDNVKLINEPFVCAASLGPDRVTSWNDEAIKILDKTLESLDEDAGDHKQYTFSWVKESLLEAPYTGKDVVFCKDTSASLVGKLDCIPKGYRHTFIIRHPNKVYKSWKDVVTKLAAGEQESLGLDTMLKMSGAEGYGYEEHYKLYEHVISMGIETDPVIIDADDLQTNPEGTLRKYCEAVGIKYSDKLLSWAANQDAAEDWSMAKLQLKGHKLVGTYTAAFESVGFKKADKIDPPARSELSDDILKCVDYAMPFYEKMLAKKLSP
ncbi:branched-chain-amino-acid aminotransferase-like protein 2 [Anneissia japonica]|uniref:branched-chain-amino-acid aminotransferase-like protein 2 n=1 Tax=Anneissia japonica TaxID=1529436 RepID=UPI0014258968|nr:branched-chain-amino-acid aminotransferase-like protein 2 [Anneissia japonica]XP_033099933.1 branched-chain-amino-acid aminotransferase-like protein 2 [Anneissia japonica]